MTQRDDNGHGLLPNLENVSERLRTSVINIGFFCAALLLIPIIASQFSRNAVIIEPIAVPQVLLDRGLTPDVVANRVWDGLQLYAGTARLARSTIVTIPTSQLIQFSLPDTGISIDSAFLQVRQFFGLYDRRIAGEIICETPDCAPAGLRLRLRVVQTSAEVVDLPPMGDQTEADYLHDAAAGVFDILDPFVYIAARAISDPEGAAIRARRLALSGHPDAKWAHNLLGDMARHDGDLPAAIADYQAALALDPAFNLSRINLALAYSASGQFTDAQHALADAYNHGAKDAALPAAYAELAIAQGMPDIAITHFRTAVARDPLDANLLARMGTLELQLGRKDDAVLHLNEALNLDPGEAVALNALGQMYRANGQIAEAERVFKAWSDYVPASAQAHLAWAEILIERHKPDDAILAYDRALALDPTNLATVMARARALLQSDKYAQAVDALTPFANAETPDPATVLLLAEVQKAAGHNRHAADRYQQYLALVPATPDRAAIQSFLLEVKQQLSNG